MLLVCVCVFVFRRKWRQRTGGTREPNWRQSWPHTGKRWEPQRDKHTHVMCRHTLNITNSSFHHFTWTKPCTVQCFCCSPKFTWWYFMVNRRNIGDWIYLFVVSSTSCLVLMQTLSDADKKQLLNFDYVHISTMVNLNMSTSQEEIRSSNIHMTGHSSPPHAKSPVIAVLASLMQFSYMREYFHPGSIY